MSKFNENGERIEEELSYILGEIPGMYTGDLSRAYKELCDYICDIVYGGGRLNRGKMHKKLLEVAENNGGLIGNVTIQDLFGIDHRRRFKEQRISFGFLMNNPTGGLMHAVVSPTRCKVQGVLG